MSDAAIKVEGLSKRYRIGVEEEQHDTFFGALASWLKSPVDNYRRVKRLSSFDEDDDDIIWALKDVSFEVERGEVVGVIGRNGAGKSTLLKILSHITEPTHGSARIHGRVSSLLEVGTGFHPELTGRENVYLNGTILGMTKAEVDRKFDEIVDFSGIEQFIDTPVKRYSSGMKVRLGFAVAAHLEPEILLIDEVLAVGDLSFQKQCIGKMEDVSRQGRTVLFVSHDMARIQSLCDRTILLRDGGIVCDHPTSETVARYIEESQDLAEENSLADRTDRTGGEQFRFTGVEFVDIERDALLDTILSGQCVEIRLQYHCSASHSIEDVAVAIGFFDSSGSFMCSLRSDVVAETYEIEPGEGYLSCVVPKWPLTTGRYYYNVNARHRGQYIDLVREAGYLSVENGDYYKSGKLPATNYQGVLVDFNWISQVSNIHI